jgi:hypothetical protein
MRDGDDARFSGIITGLAEMYSKEISDGALMLWFEALKAYDIDAISAAASAHVSSPDSGQFMPRPADIIKMIGGTSKDSAFLAWSKVDKAVQRVGNYKSVVFDDPLIHAVISDMGGWISFGEKTEDEWPFIGNEFKSRYQGYKSRGEVPEYNGKLLGLSEANNRTAGFEIAPPVLIGDAVLAKRVLECATGKSLQITTASEAVMSALGKISGPQLCVVGQ